MELEKKQAATRERVKRYRERAKALQDKVEDVTPAVTQYPAIIYALMDKRKKLDEVYRSLKDARQDKNVYYGNPYNGISFDIVGEMLEVTS